MNRRLSMKGIKTLKYIALAITLVYVCLVSFKNSGDTRVYLAAAQYLSEGQSIYGLLVEYNQRGNIEILASYLYSPFFAVLLLPLTLLPKVVSLFIWHLINIYLLYLLFRKMSSYFPACSEKTMVIINSISFILCLRFFGNNMELGQMSFLILALSFLGLDYIMNQRRDILGGFLLALGIIFKILPIVFVPYLLYKGHFKATLYVIGFTILFLLAPALYLGWGDNIDLHALWFETINPNKDFYALETKAGLYNLSAYVPALLSDIPYQGLDDKYNILNLSLDHLKIVINGLRLLFVGFALYFVGLPNFKGRKMNPKKQFWEWSYLLLVIPLIFPRQSKYSFYFVLPTLYFLLHSMTTMSKKQIWINITILATYFILSQLTSVNIIGRTLYDMSQFLKLITYSCVILIIGLCINKPKTQDVLEE